MIFFSDPLESLSHEPDIKALLRLAIAYCHLHHRLVRGYRHPI
jgi:methylglyoxal synthase